MTSRPQGRASLFTLTHPDAVLALLHAAEDLLELTGEAVALCPRYGTSTLQDLAGGGRSAPVNLAAAGGLPLTDAGTLAYGFAVGLKF